MNTLLAFLGTLALVFLFALAARRLLGAYNMSFVPTAPAAALEIFREQ